MRRKTFDAMAVAAGLVIAALLLVAGGLLAWGHSFVDNEVHNQLAAQKIVFPTANSPEIKAPEFAAMHQYAGQLMTTGAQAEVYADHFIANHLKEIGGGKTYSQLSAQSLAQPKNAALAAQVQTVFRGETLRGLLAVDVARGGSARHVTSAAGEVQRLSQDTGDRVLVLHVHEVAYGRFGRLQVDCGDGEGEKIVDQIVSDLRSAGVTADGEIRTTDVGHIARAILVAAEECDARMIVLGSSSHTDLPHLPFGSVSHRLLHLARRPVLIVPWRPKDSAAAIETDLAASAASIAT